MAHYTRPVRTDVTLVAAYPSTGESVLHAEGCAHTKGSRTVREAQTEEYDAEGVYEDDWWMVAPCAASGSAKGWFCTGHSDGCDF